MGQEDGVQFRTSVNDATLCTCGRSSASPCSNSSSKCYSRCACYLYFLHHAWQSIMHVSTIYDSGDATRSNRMTRKLDWYEGEEVISTSATVAYTEQIPSPTNANKHSTIVYALTHTSQVSVGRAQNVSITNIKSEYRMLNNTPIENPRSTSSLPFPIYLSEYMTKPPYGINSFYARKNSRVKYKISITETQVNQR